MVTLDQAKKIAVSPTKIYGFPVTTSHAMSLNITIDRVLEQPDFNKAWGFYINIFSFVSFKNAKRFVAVFKKDGSVFTFLVKNKTTK